jgi:hypothetical protein
MSVRREVFTLILLVLLVDGVFVGLYFLTGLRDGSNAAKLGFTVLWTLLTLLVVIRGLSRVRIARLNRSR